MSQTSPPPFRPGQSGEFSVSEMAGSEALAKLDGYPVFIADAVPGDRVQGRIISAKPTYARALLQEVLEPSPQRIVSPCPIIKACGGCQWGQMAYDEQLRQKERILVEALHYLGGQALDDLIHPIIPSPQPYRYRNKNQFVIGAYRQRIFAGFYRPRSHDKVEVPACYQQPEELDAALAKVMGILQAEKLTAYDEQTGHGYLRHLILRRGESTREILVGLVTRTRGRDALPRIAMRISRSVPGVVGFVQNVNPHRTNVILGEQSRVLQGRGYYFEKVGGMTFQVSLASFFQVNTGQAQAMLATIDRQADLRGCETVVDAYAGVGTIALSLARRARRVVAIEESPSAVADCHANARHNRITNLEVQAGTVEELLPPQLLAKPDLLILDPPRAGCSPAVLRTIIEAGVPRLVYTSCHPATLARDLKILTAGGYRIGDIQPIDMFPQTYHLEAVTLLEKQG